MSHLRSRTGAWVGALIAMALGAGALAPAVATARSHLAGRVWFPRDVLALGYATKLGTASPTQAMQIGIGLKDPNPAGEAALESAQQNPASPAYQHFLTPAQFDSRFAVSKATFAKVLTWLQKGGAHVIDTPGPRNYVEVSATVKQVD